MNPSTPTSPAAGSVQYDISNKLPLGTSSSYSVAPASSPAPSTAPITSASIAPAAPIAIPDPLNTAANAATSAIGAAQGLNDNLTKSLKAEEDALKASVSDQKKAVQASVDKLMGRSAAQAEAETAAGVDTLRSTARTLADEYNTKTLAYNAQYKSIAQNAGLSSDQRARQLAAVTNQHAFDQTDLSIRSNIAQGNYAAAQALVDKKIDIEYGGLKDLISFQSSMLSSDRSDLSEKTQARIGILLDDNKAKLVEATYQAHQLQDTKNDLLKSAAIQNAPQDIQAAIQSAKDTTSAIAAAGQYAGDILDRQIKRAQLSKTNMEIAKLNAEKNALTIPAVTNPDGAKYKEALNVILGSGKFTAAQKAAVTTAVNNGQDPFTVIKNQAKSLMPAAEATTVANYETAKSTLSDIDAQLKDYYANGGKTGVLSGNFESAVNKLGSVSDPKLVEIATQLAASIQVYRNAVSGTAYSVQEGKQIDSVFPGINKSQGLNAAIVNGRNKAFDSAIDGAYKNVLGGVYSTIKEEEAKTAPPAASASANPFSAALSPQTGFGGLQNGMGIYSPATGYVIPNK